MADFGKDKFAEGLERLGYEVEDKGSSRLAIKHTIGQGRFKGCEVLIGFEVPGDFELTPPSGPHISPRLLPINTGGADHHTRAHESPNFGDEWEYLSRPFPVGEWPRQRNVGSYLNYVIQLLETL